MLEKMFLNVSKTHQWGGVETVITHLLTERKGTSGPSYLQAMRFLRKCLLKLVQFKMFPWKNSLWINVIVLNFLKGSLEQSREAQDLGKMAEQLSSDLRPP